MTEDTREIHSMLHSRARSLLIVPLLLCAALAGCSGSSEPATTPVPAVTTAAAPSPEEEATAAFQRYWDAYVQMANSGDVQASSFNGVADGSFIEGDLKALGDQADAGVVRTGEPTFSDYETTVDGDTATSLVCFDESSWGAAKDGEPLPDASNVEPSPFTATLKKRDDAWIVTDLTFKESTPCP